MMYLFILRLFMSDFKVKNAPCFQCKDRHIGCHGTCSKYIAFSRSRDEARNARLHEIDVESYYRRKHLKMKGDYA